MGIETTLVNAKDIKQDMLYWIQGDPNNPELGLLLLYQRTEGSLNFDYEFYSATDSNHFSVELPRGNIKSESTRRGGFNLNNVGELTQWEGAALESLFKYFQKCTQSPDEKMHLDIVLVPHGFGEDKGRNLVLGNYIAHYLKKSMGINK